MLDFATLEPPSSPNFYLVCPPHLCKAEVPQGISPEFPVRAAVLRELLLKILSREPHITMVAWNDDQMTCEFVLRSTIFKFPDRISIQFFRLGQHRSTLAVYSRAIFGRYDFGANKRRLERWLDQLSRDARRKSVANGAP